MAEYINREATIALLTERLIETANNNVGYVCDAGITFQDAAERLRKYWINEIHVEEVEPVIRCRECKWFDGVADGEIGKCNYETLIRYGDFFCANAERREES